MTEKLKKVKLKGNESFNFREGWLRKGMRCVEECPALFSQADVMERLGVGSKMVKSIRYWLQATNLSEEHYGDGGKGRIQILTEDFGKIIEENDPYFDDYFTLFLLHYQIVKNEEFSIVWNIFFNEFDAQDFTKENMIDACSTFLSMKMETGCGFSEKSFEDDCASVIRMYLNSEETLDPEDSLKCPLAELGLLQKSIKNKNAFIRTMPSRINLDKLAVLYVVISNLDGDKTSVSIDDLLNSPNNLGHVFNLDRITINEYLEQLRISGYLTINRTAGLDIVYLKNALNPSEIMKEYYKKVQGK